MISAPALMLGYAAALASRASADAQSSRTGSHISGAQSDEWDYYDLPEVRKIEDGFGRCVVKGHRTAAIRFVLDQSEKSRKRLIPAVADSGCLVSATTGAFGLVQMKLTGDSMKYALSDALVREQFGSVAITDFTAVPPLFHEVPDLTQFEPKPGKKMKPKEVEDLAARKSDALAFAALAHYGECVVRTGPAASFALLATKPETAEERTAFAALQPSLAGCLDAGQTIKINKVFLRGAIAYNYYRLAVALRSLPVQTAGVTK